MYMKDLPSSITHFSFISDAQDVGKDSWLNSWLKIVRVTNIGQADKEAKQKILRLSPEDQAILYRLLQEKFEG